MSVPGEDETGLAAGLEAVVRRRFGDAAKVVGLERLSGGASQELWSFDVESGAQRMPLILRRNPGGFVQRESAAGMETEAHLSGLARGTGTPAPEVVHVCAPEDGLGRGYVMERLSGETIARRILRDPQYADARLKLARQIGAAAAHIHQVDVTAAGALRVSSPEASVEASYAGYRGY
jgi:aminoglycoside phosphotransferase (APT) family kinase protein